MEYIVTEVIVYSEVESIDDTFNNVTISERKETQIRQ